MALKHKKTSLVEDGADESLIQPGDWNDDHVADFTDSMVKVDATGALVAAVEGVDYGTGGGLDLPVVAPIVLTNTGGSSASVFLVTKAAYVAALGSDNTATEKPTNCDWVTLVDTIVFILYTPLGAGASIGISFTAGSCTLNAAYATRSTTGDSAGSFIATGSISYSDGIATMYNSASLSTDTLNYSNTLIVLRGKTTNTDGMYYYTHVLQQVPSDGQYHICSMVFISGSNITTYTDGSIARTFNNAWSDSVSGGVVAATGATAYLDYMHHYNFVTTCTVATNPEATGLLTVGAGGALSLTIANTFAPAAKGVTNGDSHDHSGGDGGQIAYSSLSGLPSIPSITGLLDETAHDLLDHTGLIGIPAAYSLPTASTTVLGGVKVDGTTVTIADGVISSNGGSGMTNPMTAAGDIIIGGTSGAPTRLAKGTDGQVLTLASGLPSWADASGGSAAIDWANPIPVTGATTLTIGRHHVCSGTTADYTVTLPAVSGNAGKLLSVDMSGALTKLVTVDGNASETIDGATSRVMWARETAVLLCDGTQWTKVGGKSIPMICSMYASDATSFVGLTSTKININTVIIDNTGRMADTVGFKIVIQRSGNYNIYSTLRYNQTNTSNTWVGNKTYRNGNLFLNSTSAYLASSYSDAKTSNLSSLVIGDYIEPYGYYGTGTFTTSTVVAGSTSAITLQVEEIITW